MKYRVWKIPRTKAWSKMGPDRYRRDGDSKVYTAAEYLDTLAIGQKGAKPGSWYKVRTNSFRRVGDPRVYTEAEFRYKEACNQFGAKLTFLAMGVLALSASWYFDWMPSYIGLLVLALAIGVFWLLKHLWDIITWRGRL